MPDIDRRSNHIDRLIAGGLKSGVQTDRVERVVAQGPPVRRVTADPAKNVVRLEDERRRTSTVVHPCRQLVDAPLDAVIAELRTRPRADVLFTSAVPGDASPVSFYEHYGFVRTGEIFDDEIVLRLDFERQTGRRSPP